MYFPIHSGSCAAGGAELPSLATVPDRFPGQQLPAGFHVN